MAGGRRVIPLAVEASPPSSPAPSPSSSPVANGGRQLPPPPKSPLYTVRRRHVPGPSQQPGGPTGDGSGSGSDCALSGFDRMLLLRQMNVTGAAASSPVRAVPHPPALVASPPPADEPEVSAAQNLKLRRAAEQRRRQEAALMRREDYVDTPEGEERLRRQEERARMLEEELAMRRLLEAEERERRRQRQLREQQEEARKREQYLAKMREQREQQERAAREKERARQLALEDRMRALKEAADAQAREQAVARQRQMERDALVDRERRSVAMETALMQLEDVLSAAERLQWLAEKERERQIEAERDQWRAFQEQEQAKLREATAQRRAAMAEQYERDKRRKMEIHRLQKQQAAVVAASVLGPQREASARAIQLPAADPEAAHPAASDNCESPEPSEKTASADQDTSPAQTLAAPASAQDETGASSESAEAVANPAEAAATALRPPPDSDGHGGAEPVVTPDQVGATPQPGDGALADQPPSADAARPSTSEPDPTPTASPLPLPPRITWTEKSAKAGGVHPFAQVQSVTGGSPAMEATLRAGDLILDFGGVVVSTPKCLLAVAECVRSHVNQAIAVVVLRPPAPGPVDGGRELHELTVSLCPRKWEGKGLLGCQLSPFKWPEPDAVGAVERCGIDASSVEASAAGTSSNGGSGSGSGSGFVVYGVQPDSAASGAGLRDGDLLVRCGGLLDITSVSTEELSQRLRRASSCQHLEVERWLADEQRYCHLSFDMDSGDQAWGFSVTTFEQYYYGPSGASSAPSTLSACTDCYYSTAPSAVHTAALNGHVECLEALLLLLEAAPSADSEAERASVVSYLEWRDGDGRTPLFYACYASQLESARFLVSRLGAFNAATSADLYGDTPLHAAVTAGCSPVVRLLLESRYMDINATNSALQTGAHVAPDAAMLRLLEGFDADLLATDSEGRMPLAYACLRDDVESVELLCAAFPDFADYADERGNTPLHLCAWLGLESAARVLVRYLPPIALFLTNLDGCSPVDLARASGASAVVALLEQAMAG